MVQYFNSNVKCHFFIIIIIIILFCYIYIISLNVMIHQC